MPIPLSVSYNANARNIPPTKASPPVAMFATPALGVVTGGVDEGFGVVGDGPLRVLVDVEIVKFELGEGKFTLVEVEMTVTVEEGTEEVVVLLAIAV